MQFTVTFNIKNTITWGLRLVEEPPFWGFHPMYATHGHEEGETSKRRMQLIVTFNIQNTITWGLRLVEEPPFWWFRLLYASHHDHLY